MKLSKISVDKVTKFGIIQPEFLKFCNKLGDYYRWFVISKEKIKLQNLQKITESLLKFFWVNAIQR